MDCVGTKRETKSSSLPCNFCSWSLRLCERGGRRGERKKGESNGLGFANGEFTSLQIPIRWIPGEIGRAGFLGGTGYLPSAQHSASAPESLIIIYDIRLIPFPVQQEGTNNSPSTGMNKAAVIEAIDI
eukprot:scaffold460_cov81-Skeletonema_menzelii.AAC.17